MYNTETVNVQFINQSFIDKVDQGHTKEASAAMTAFVRQKLREDGFARKIFTPQLVTSAELDRQVTEDPTIIVEKEIDSVAANLPFLGRPEVRYFTGVRYPVTFHKIQSANFKKSKFELATYRTDIRTVLQENSVKDLQKQEDENFYENLVKVATDNSNIFSISGGFNIVNLKNGIKNLLAKQLPVGRVLMTQEMYADLLAEPATQIGGSLASDLVSGRGTLDSAFGFPIVTTIKNDILPNNRCIVFAPEAFLGQMYLLQDATVFLKTEADMLEFQTYESAGIGIGNVNGAVILDF